MINFNKIGEKLFSSKKETVIEPVDQKSIDANKKYAKVEKNQTPENSAVNIFSKNLGGLMGIEEKE